MDVLPPDFDYLEPDFDYEANFRFSRDEIHWLGPHLHLPEVIVHRRSGSISRFKCLCLVLYRLAWPNRFTEAMPLFRSPASKLSIFFNLVIIMIHRHWKHLLLWDHVRLTPQFLTRCTEAVQAKGCLLREAFGFLDGTAMRICRPMRDQEEFYSGHKKYHCLKFQAI
ncbi:MAG: hypothetical protein BYD32DRAFT_370263, partial [Podila humilis]